MDVVTPKQFDDSTDRTKNMNPLEDQLFQLALTEDLGSPPHDVTTDLLFPNNQTIAQANIISKHAEIITVCGINLIAPLFSKLSADCKIQTNYQDGDRLAPGETLLTIEATAPSILKIERTLLNFLRHLSAIATLTAKYVERVKNTQLKILDTRKTTPGFRSLEKHAVHCGGGVNHRFGLYDAIMIKDTHVDILGGMQQALNKLLTVDIKNLPVIVEVRTPEELDQVLTTAAHKVTRVLLDNMSLEIMQQCVAKCEGIVDTEASGNIRLDTVLAIAQTGVHYASVGELTYNAGQVDLSMTTSHKP
jgi:nicotinate-nucleotide pyrophosphorylase (carboxylating)